jgi:hypothetical protein
MQFSKHTCKDDIHSENYGRYRSSEIQYEYFPYVTDRHACMLGNKMQTEIRADIPKAEMLQN